jgi:hypothetical protein
MAPELERESADLALATLAEVTDVATWVRSDWLALHRPVAAARSSNQ